MSYFGNPALPSPVDDFNTTTTSATEYDIPFEAPNAASLTVVMNGVTLTPPTGFSLVNPKRISIPSTTAGLSLYVKLGAQAGISERTNYVYPVASGVFASNILTANYSPSISALTDKLMVAVDITGTNPSASPTFSPDGMSPREIVDGAGNSISAANLKGSVILMYSTTTNKWKVTGLTYPSAASVSGLASNLKMSTTGTNALATLTADEIVLKDSTNTFRTFRTVSASINSAATGVNGLDINSTSASTWYAVFVIGKADGTSAGLLSLSATDPILPTGYTFKARVGWVRTDSTANKFLLPIVQFGKTVRYTPATGTNVTSYPIMATGTAGTVSGATITAYAAVAVGNFVPPTACMIAVGMYAFSGTGQTQWAAVSPNNNTNIEACPIVVGHSTTATVSELDAGSAILALDTTNIYYVSGITTGRLTCQGWEDLQ